MERKNAKSRIRDAMRADQAAYDARTRRLKEYLEQRGVPTGDDPKSYEARTQRLEAAIARYAGDEQRASS